MGFRHAKQVQSPLPWPAAGPTPTLSIPTLLPAMVLNILVLLPIMMPNIPALLPARHSAKHPSTTAFPPLPAIHTAQRAAALLVLVHNPARCRGMWGSACSTGELRQAAGSGHGRDSRICGVQGAGQPLSLLLSGAAFPAWAAARPLPLPVAPAEGPCPHRGHRPGEGLNGNLMAGLPEIAKPLGKAAPPRAGKAEASSQLCPSCVDSQLLPSPEYFHVVGQHRVPDTHLPWLMVSPHPPYPQPWESSGWGLAADADASADANADASHSLPWCLAPSLPAHLGTQKPVPGPSWYHSPGILAAGA